MMDWVLSAAKLPLAFAQVREDAAVDEQLAGERVLLVASGGCTAAALAALPQVAELTLVDSNPAQIALSMLKLQLLADAGTEERLALLGHLPLRGGRRNALLGARLRRLGLAPDSLGPQAFVARVGPDHAGRYELLFKRLRLALNRGPWDRAFAEVMSLENLRGLFGAAATANRRIPFARHFSGRLRGKRGDQNPYLAQILRGRFPKGVLTPWLLRETRKPRSLIRYETTPMDAALTGKTRAFDSIHLSNILDWLPPKEAQSLLSRARQALRPGGRLIVRQLNSRLDIPALGQGLRWDEPNIEERSFLYRALYVGVKS